MLLPSLNSSHQAHIPPITAPTRRLTHSSSRSSQIAFAASLVARPAETVADVVTGQWRAEPCSQPAERPREYENNIVSSVLKPDDRSDTSDPALETTSSPQAATSDSTLCAEPAAPQISKAEAARRQKISASMQQRWQSPALDLRSTLRHKMKGKEPWNKGKQMSAETRQKMSAAKQARRHSTQTRALMSKSHMGLPQPESKGVLISSKLLDKPKSQRHREAIATAQRRRLAAHRVLQAIEAVHRHSDVTGLAGAVRCARTSAVLVPGLPAAHEKQSRAQVLDSFQGLLHEFRSLQQELGPWTAAFQEQHARKPRMTDVEKTGIPWLENKYKQYVVMRERVLTETQALRDKLLQAVPDIPQQSGDAAAFDKTNANRVGATSSAVAARMASALAYRSSKLAAERPPEPPSSTVLPTSTVLPSADSTSAAASLEQPAASTSASSSQRSVPVPNHGSTPRVRTALMAAAEYRRKKVEETVAAAQTAADNARLPKTATKASGRRAKAAAAAAAGTGAATLITGHKFEGRQAGQARKAVQAASALQSLKLEEGSSAVEARDIEIDAVSDLAADLDKAAAELLAAHPLASISPA